MKPIYRYHLPAGLAAMAVLMVAVIPGPSLPRIPGFGVDKVIHAAEFAVLGALFYRYLSHSSLSGHSIIFGITGTFLWSLVTEIIQLPIPGRHCDLMDILADLVGILVVFGGIVLKKNMNEREKTIDKNY